MQTKRTRQFSSLLNEHWKRKQRLKLKKNQLQSIDVFSPAKRPPTIRSDVLGSSDGVFYVNLRQRGCKSSQMAKEKVEIAEKEVNKSIGSDNYHRRTRRRRRRRHSQQLESENRIAIPTMTQQRPQLLSSIHRSRPIHSDGHLPPEASAWKIRRSVATVSNLSRSVLFILATSVFLSLVTTATQIHSADPRPTIYSGQVSFGLLLSAHSSTGSELSTAASSGSPLMASVDNLLDSNSDSATTFADLTTTTLNSSSSEPLLSGPAITTTKLPVEVSSSSRSKRQIFERTGSRGNVYASSRSNQKQVAKSSLGGGTSSDTQQPQPPPTCGLVNSNSLYAGMSAIWASHQANLVGDSHLAIGTYVYDSCNDLDVGQRQAVRIVSNLNAFQQTTCESPRGSPISLTIAHGDNQLRAIQLLTSFKVPVITTKEHFALEDYNQLKGDQKKFLFSTAHSSRHLAMGSLKFTKRIVTRSTSSPKLLNQFYKMSSRNGLIVISRNLPARFISYLTTFIPNHVNYEMLESSQPIDQIKSVEAIESILLKSNSGLSGSSGSSSSESRISIKVASPLQKTMTTATAASSFNRQTRETSNALDADSDSSSSPLSLSSSSSSLSSSDGSTGGSGGDFDPPEPGEQHKMLSPTILMFITPSEAIDLITRLRNDLAEVSRYYSLIVSTREDISPALRTIFHRGGSRLCSGKAFYTISPKPDDINEFSRYFRDTVQMEGETSDHPLICEFAKYQSTSKLSADLDDVSTEPVIKAVWAAAAAFKSVYRRECSALASGSSSESIAAGGVPGRSISSRQSSSGGGASGTATSNPTQSTGGGGSSKQQSHPDCMVKMNKVMSSLVQRALKRMDVTINSTGLQAFDGFRIKFDDLNELMTNKFSIKYINKECEITEVGQFSGFKESQLSIDDDLLMKSLESTLPEQWPPPPPPVPVIPVAVQTAASSLPSGSGGGGGGEGASGAAGSSSSSAAASTGGARSSSDSSTNSDGLGGGDGNSLSGGSPGGGDSTDGSSDSSESSSSTPGKRRGQKSVLQDSDFESSNKPDGSDGDDGESDNDSGGSGSSRNRKRSRVLSPGDMVDQTGNRLARGNQNQQQIMTQLMSSGKIMTLTRPQTVAAPVTALSGRGLVPGATDATEYATAKPMRKLKPFPNASGSTLKEWVPTTRVSSESMANPITTTILPETTTTGGISGRNSNKQKSIVTTRQMEQDTNGSMDSGSDGSMKTSATTQAPVYTTLPESDGNADLEPTSKQMDEKQRTRSSALPKGIRSTLEAASSDIISTKSPTSMQDNYVTSPSITQNHLLYQNNQRQDQSLGQARNGFAIDGSSTLTIDSQQPGSQEPPVRFNYMRDINTSPIPMNAQSTPGLQAAGESSNFVMSDKLRLADSGQIKSDPAKASRSKMRSQLKWIYSSWFALTILGANICGALLTLYVLTFLLMKNCDGSLDRENQGIRSMHLLSIIVVFFGSTLFIVYPTPGLCLLRTSWHNFALVLLFGSLLLQTMQTRSLNSIGLGGRPNRLNQFLTLVFMVGVQVSFELQRWKYESSSYVNFVNQYFGSTEGSDKKLIVLSSSIANQFNPLNSFNDQVTPVSIQVSEKYQNLLQDYCTQHTEDFIQSQIYLFMIVILLLIFSVTTRKSRSSRLNSPGNMSHSLTGGGGKQMVSVNQTHQKLAAALGIGSSGKLSALSHSHQLHQHEAANHHHHHNFKFSSNVTNARENANNLFVVSLIITCLYFSSIFLHTYGQNNGSPIVGAAAASTNHDLIFSVTLVSIAFVTLMGIFMPILRQVHRYEDEMADPISGTISRPVITQSKLHANSGGLFSDGDNNNIIPNSSSSANTHSAFAMFPEFAQTGHRRPSSMSDGTSSSGAGSRRPFAETKESRRNMAGALANLGLATGGSTTGEFDPALLNLKLNLANATMAIDTDLSPIADELFKGDHGHRQQQHQAGRRSPTGGIMSGGGGGGEKRLIMLDVDPCCPRHGHVVNGTTSRQSNKCQNQAVASGSSSSSNNNKRNSYVSTSSASMARQSNAHSHLHHHHHQGHGNNGNLYGNNHHQQLNHHHHHQQ